MTRKDRRHLGDRPDDERSRFQRDRDRVLYSSHFRRLAGITQVITPNQLHVVHNRLTHSLEVAQIARRLAQYWIDDKTKKALLKHLGDVDLDVVETAALAHDLGHPPFGHVAEEQLQASTLGDPYKFGGAFNGNAQSLRILTKLSVRSEAFQGLNLTRATLNAVLKYPWFRGLDSDREDRWGAYGPEGDDFKWAREGEPGEQRSLEAEIMDWADDVAYAVHDLEDFIRVGLIPIERLSLGFGDEEAQRFYEANQAHFDTKKKMSKSEVEEAFDATLGVLTVSNSYRGVRSDRVALRTTTSTLIKEFIGALTPNENYKPGQKRALVDRRMRNRAELLKRLTWFYVIDSPSLSLQQEGHRRIIKVLFDTLADAAMSGGPTSKTGTKPWNIFPESHRERLMTIHLDDPKDHMDAGLEPDKQKLRLVVDYIASLTEAQAVEIYSRLSGNSLRSALEPVSF